ncbi:peptidase C19 family protein [Tieghemostelium lacteum]|uniref:Peptidase C19 family protein n=1 Tax=Tieghemostelium lacteum TaxID=361077 RepID=A0A151ZSB8_TIELA|nr:peptidase C19 family protein [Tieghemostelium lacteum]|eukprot:KYQ96883.1 peptidase C19 family protein [Tieghemostelium lacteum]
MKDERLEQSKIIRENWKEYSPGDTVNIISAHWLKSWKSYVKYEDSSPVLQSKQNGSPQQQQQHENGNGNGNVNPLSKSIQFDTPKPESINNRDIVDGKDADGEVIIRSSCSELEDYEIIPNAVWKLLDSWYPGGGPVIERKVIELGLKNEKYVEVKPILFHIRFHQSFLTEVNAKTATGITESSTTQPPQQSQQQPPLTPNSTMLYQRSRKSTLQDFKEYFSKKYPNIDVNKIMIYSESNPLKPKLLKKYYLTLEDLKLELDPKLRLHYQYELTPHSKLGKLGKKFTGLFSSSSSSKKDKHSSSNSSTSGGSHGISANSSTNQHSQNGTPDNLTGSWENTDTTPNKEVVLHKGACGLTNLGNTCFMNSSIQCLAHTTPLAEYFLSNRYIGDINKVNPLGMKGQIAEIYGKLMKDMWGGSSCVVPKNLKWIIGKYAPQFSGLSQQDSQELLSFLLDGLHEDLNKVLKKPYQEDKPEPKEQREDSVVALEQWENHLKRNQSVIVSLFQGQYKSTLVCAKCSKISITFDPFMFVPLPIPVPTDIIFDVLLFRCKPIEAIQPDPKGIHCINQAMAPVRYCLKLSKIDTVETLRVQLSKMTGIESACIALAETFRNRIQSFLNDQKYLAHVRDRDLIIAYELPIAGEDVSRIHVMHRYKSDLLLLPYVLILKYSETTCKDIYRMVWERVGHRVKKGWKSVLQQKLQANSSSNNTPTTTTTTGTTTNGVDQSPQTFKKNNSNNTLEEHNSSGETNISSPTEFSQIDEDDNSSIDDSFENLYPFVLKTTNGYGNNCDRCESGCTGCVVEPDDRLLNSVYKTSKFWREGCNNIVIDWRPEVNKFCEFSDEPSNPFTVQDKSTALKGESRSEITLNDCFSIFTKSEKLGSNDTWYCPQCKTHIEGSTKKLELWSAPKILVINLKRFSYHTHRHEKIGVYVDFPIDQLDLSKWILNKNGPSPIYQLYAVSNHMGGVGSGHYTSCVKNRNQWFHISDSSVQPIEKSKVKSNEAYVLFYELIKQPPQASIIQNPSLTTSTNNSSNNNNNTSSTTTTSTTTSSTNNVSQ